MDNPISYLCSKNNFYLADKGAARTYSANVPCALNGESARLLDVEGEGFISEMYFSSTSPESRLKIKVDGRIFVDDTFKNVFAGNNADFPTRLVRIYNEAENGGLSSFVKIPFGKHITVYAEGIDVSGYYINYVLISEGKFVASEYDNLNEVNNFLGAGKSLVKPDFIENITLGAESEPIKFEGAAVIDAMRIKIDGLYAPTEVVKQDKPYTLWSKIKQKLTKKPTLRRYTADCITDIGLKILEKISIKIKFDGVDSVDAPLGMFFCQSSLGSNKYFRDYVVRSAYVGIDYDGALYCNFPMPFNKSVEISFSGTLSTSVTAEIAFSARPLKAEEQTLGFFTVYSDGDSLNEGCGIDGAGILLGINAQGADFSDKARVNIKTDNALFSQYSFDIDGLFCASNGFDNGVYCSPVSGCSYYSKRLKGGFNNIESKVDDYSAYRFFTGGGIIYRDGLEIRKSVGTMFDKTLLFLYGKSEKAVAQSVGFAVDDVKKRSAYGYIAESEKQYAIEFKTSDSELALNVGVVNSGETIKFETALFNNETLLLKRVLDNSIPDQRAEVYINGAYAGVWFDGGNDKSGQVKESLFCVPQKFTSGAKTLSIKLIVTSESFTAIEYTMVFLKP